MPTFSPTAELPLLDRRAAAWHGAARASVTSRLLAIVGLSVGFFAAADVGLFSTYDGVAFATLCSILQPRLAPCLLVLVISVHDAPGMATPALYFGVAGVALGMGLDEAIASRRRTAALTRRVNLLVALVAGLAVYGVGSSFLNELLAGREQSPYRHYSIIAALMAAMPLIAWLAARRVMASLQARRELGVACCCALAHIVAVVAMEWRYGPLYGTSRAGALEISAAAQLIDQGARGVSRFTGPFLTPNNLAYVPAVLLLLVLWAGESTRITKRYLASYVGIGGGLAVLAASRSMFGFFGVTAAYMCWRHSKFAAIGVLLVIAGVLGHGMISEDAWAFARLDDVSFEGSTRQLLWDTVVGDFGVPQWVFGAGLSHWDILFERVYFEDRVSDPHNWILSAAGMFGVLGLLFYTKLGATLLRAARHNSPARNAVAVSLIVLYFGRDLMGVQYLLNNHPNTCLNWLLICLLCRRGPVASSRPRAQGNAWPRS